MFIGDDSARFGQEPATIPASPSAVSQGVHFFSKRKMKNTGTTEKNYPYCFPESKKVLGTAGSTVRVQPFKPFN